MKNRCVFHFVSHKLQICTKGNYCHSNIFSKKFCSWREFRNHSRTDVSAIQIYRYQKDGSCIHVNLHFRLLQLEEPMFFSYTLFWITWTFFDSLNKHSYALRLILTCVKSLQRLPVWKQMTESDSMATTTGLWCFVLSSVFLWTSRVALNPLLLSQTKIFSPFNHHTLIYTRSIIR